MSSWYIFFPLLLTKVADHALCWFQRTSLKKNRHTFLASSNQHFQKKQGICCLDQTTLLKTKQRCCSPWFLDVLHAGFLGGSLHLGFPAIATFLNVIDVGPTADGLEVAAPFSDGFGSRFRPSNCHGLFSNLQMEMMSVNHC